MRIKRMVWGFFCVLFLIAGTTLQARGEEPEDGISLYATAAVLMDADTGRVLFGKNADTPMAMASTTKILTCILVLENASLDECVTVSSYAAGMPKVHLGIRKGEEYTVRDLLYSLMLESHNDSAAALAEHVGRKLLPEEKQEKPASEYSQEESREAIAAFARLMNEKAVSLGCRDSWFITPNGLDATQEFTLKDGSSIVKEHSTTAAELAGIMRYCIGGSVKSGDFLAVTGTQDYQFFANGRSFSCTNHNAFLNMMDGALSGKTGFTNKAGYCYVGSLVRDDRTFIVALLACGWPNHKTWKWSDTRQLMQYGIDNYFYRSFAEEAFDESCLRPLPVLNGQTHILGETAYTDIGIERGEATDGGMGSLADTGSGRALEKILLREDETIEVECQLERELTAPVPAGTQVGEIRYLVDGTVYRTERIVTKNEVSEISLFRCAEQIISRFLLSGASFL